MKIAVCQTMIYWEDKEKNLQKLKLLLEQALESSCSLILLPEMSFTGFSMQIARTGEENMETIAILRKLQKEYPVVIGFGWTKLINTECKGENHYTILDKDGAILSDYTKIHPFSYAKEDEYFQGGRCLSFFYLDGIRFSTLICYDLRFPELFQIAADQADVIIVAANWPAARSLHWKALLQARAIETQCYIIGVNCVGEMNQMIYSGDSCAIAPSGEIICMVSNKEQLFNIILEKESVNQYREAFPVRKDRRKALYLDLYQ